MNASLLDIALLYALGALGFLSCAPAESSPASDGAQAAPQSGKLVAGCATGDPERERVGTDCSCCHGTQFAVSGSVEVDAIPRIVRVEVDDRAGNHAEMSPNAYGNFFRHQPRLDPPLRARVVLVSGEVREMRDPAPSAACNTCHGLAGTAPGIGAERR